MDQKPRPHTVDEMQDEIVTHTVGMVGYWNGEHGSNVEQGTRTVQDLASGLLHSLLAMLDGSTMSIPGLDLQPSPQPHDTTARNADGRPVFQTDDTIGGRLAWGLYNATEPVVDDGDDPFVITVQQIEHSFLLVLRGITAQLPDQIQSAYDTRDDLERTTLAFFGLIATGNPIVPPMALLPVPHPDDREHHIQEGANYWPENVDLHAATITAKLSTAFAHQRAEA